MGLDAKPIKMVPELETGIHLVSVNKFGFVSKTVDGQKQIVKNEHGEKLFSIVYADHQGKKFENIYALGGDKQKYFEKVLHMIGIDPKGTISGKDALNKRLYICVKEVVDIKDDTIELDINGEEVKNFYIFEVFPFVDGGHVPTIKGDPAKNNGIPSGVFRTYRNIAHSFIEEAAVVEPKIEMEAPKVEKKEEEEPNFDMPASVSALEAARPQINVNVASPVITSTGGEIKGKTLEQVWNEEPNFD